MIYWLRYPMFVLFLVQCMGILLAYNISKTYSFWIITSVCVFTTIFFCLKKWLCNINLFSTYKGFIFWAIIAFGWGCGCHYFYHVFLSDTDIRTLMKDKDAQIAIVEGVLLERPAIYISVSNNGKTNIFWRNTLSIESIQWDGDHSAIANAKGKIYIACSEKLNDHFRAGTRIRATGILKFPNASLINGEFDYRKYLETYGIFYELRIKNSADCIHLGLDHHILSYFRFLADHFRGYSIKALSLGYGTHDPYIAIYQAMTVGERNMLENDMKNIFMHLGIMHLLAISGFNILMITGIIGMCFSIFRIPHHWRSIFLILIVWFYAISVGAEVPVTRAALMVTVILLGYLLSRPTTVLNSLGGAGFILLSFEPIQLFQVSFQLSFIAVISLILLVPIFSRLTENLIKPDEFLIPSLVTSAEKIKCALWAFVWGNVWASVAAWLGTLPLCIRYFKIFPTIGILTNILVVPLAFPLQSLSIISTAFGKVIPQISIFCNKLAHLILEIIEKICLYGNSFSISWFRVNNWNGWCDVLYIIAILGIISGLFLKRKNRSLLFTYLFCISMCAYFLYVHIQEVSMRIVVFPAGEGGCIYIKDFEKQKDYLIDTGNKNFWRSKIISYIKQNLSVNNYLSTLILTHGDANHIGGAISLIDQINVDKIYINPLKTRSIYMQMWQEKLSDPRCKERIYNTWCGINIDSLEVLHPTRGDTDFTRADQGTIVLRIQRKNKRIMFLSDLEPDGQERMINRLGNDLKCDVLISGKCDYAYTYCSGFIERTNPKILILQTNKKTVKINAAEVSPEMQVIYIRDKAFVLDINIDGEIICK